MDNDVEYTTTSAGSKAVYQMIGTDSRGLRIMEPYLGVSIDGSEFYPVDRITEMATIIRERGGL